METKTLNLIDFAELQAVLQDYAKDAEEMYKYQVSLGGHNASRKLADTVEANVVVGEEEYSVTLKLQDYWKYLEHGSQGTVSSPPDATGKAHFPPPNVIMKWIEVKPIIPRPTSSGQIPTPKQLAYLIGRKIHREGIEPFPALSQTKQELMEQYKERIAKALAMDVGSYLQKMVQENMPI